MTAAAERLGNRRYHAVKDYLSQRGVQLTEEQKAVLRTICESLESLPVKGGKTKLIQGLVATDQ